jgi:hypothetical protein
VILRTTTLSAQQLSIHSSFPCTANQPQPKQTGPEYLNNGLLAFSVHFSQYALAASQNFFSRKRKRLLFHFIENVIKRNSKQII